MLRNSFNKSLIESFRYLLDACDEAVPVSLYEEISKKLDSLNPDEKLSGLFSLLHGELFKAVEAGDAAYARTVLEQASPLDLQCSTIRYLDFLDLNDFFAPLILHTSIYTISQERQKQVDIQPLSPQHFQEMEDSFKHGFAELESISPELYEESQILISELLFYNSLGLKAGSSFDFFGMVYCNYKHDWRRLTDLLAIITHEQAHLYVHLLNNDDPILHNADEIHHSHLRNESRPLMGIYHAAFVLARMCYVLEQALKLGKIPSEERDYCKDQIAHFKSCHEGGVDVVNQYAQMTPLAQGLIDSAQKLVA